MMHELKIEYLWQVKDEQNLRKLLEELIFGEMTTVT